MIYNFKYLTLFLFIFLVSPITIWAQVSNDQTDVSSNECNLSTGCGWATTGNSWTSSKALINISTYTGTGCKAIGSTGSYCGAKSTIAPQKAAIPIDAYGVCYYVDNKSTTNSIFIPFGNRSDWNSFIKIALSPANQIATLTPCSKPYWRWHPSRRSSPITLPPYADCANTSEVISNPTVYGRPNLGTWTPNHNTFLFTCHNGATVVNGFRAWQAIEPGTINSDGWTQFSQNSPDLILTAIDTTNSNNSGSSIIVKSGNPIVLNWNSDSTAQACTTSWLGSVAGMGSYTLTPATDKAPIIYTISCKNQYGLTSTATATVTISDTSPTCTLGASQGVNPDSPIEAYTSVNLYWTAINSSSVIASGGWSGSLMSLSGNQTIRPASTTSYSIICSNPSGTNYQSTVTIYVK